MSTASVFSELMERYKRDHTHPINKATHMVGIPMIVISLPLLFLQPATGLGLFVLGWVLQFIGHAFEGKKPSFLSDPRFLLVGVAFFVEKVRKLGRQLRRS
ncbi:MAG TPA: DUF962 domain-containing protein [Deltaproteobacteria bacterium]|nr:permease [Deltaproteobacteria bacterium]HCP45696.1 DUF962 domain-containing protein [Deltaproteobacteria bacterium]